MKSCIWCVCLCAILMLVASPGVLADTHTVPNGGGWASGSAGGSGWDTGCSSSASADGSFPSSQANYYASRYVYTDQAGWFYVNWDCWAWGGASYTDQTGSGASGTGAGGASTYGGGASAGMSLSSDNQIRSYADDDYDPGYSGMTEEAVWFDAFAGVSASSDSGAAASVGSSQNTAGAGGQAYATVGLSG